MPFDELNLFDAGRCALAYCSGRTEPVAVIRKRTAQTIGLRCLCCRRTRRHSG